jgi:long-chain acyl-CoA synthetase
MEADLHTLTLSDVLSEHRRSRPQRTAVVCGDDRFTYAELDERVTRLADALGQAGVGAGGRVLWLGQNCHRLLETLLAAGRLGASLCPANWRQAADELAFVVQDLEPAVVIWQDEEIGEVVRAARRQAGFPAAWYQHDDASAEAYEALLASGNAVDRVSPVSPAATVLLLYTAAFGGRPSAAQLSHQALHAQSMIVGALQEIAPDYVYLTCGPLFHMATLMTALATFCAGGALVFSRRVDADEVCRLVQQERCTGAFVLAPSAEQIVAINGDGKYDLSSLRALPGSVSWNEMVTVDTSPWGRRPGGYGQTEVAGLATFNALGEGTIGTHGRTSPFAQLRVVDDDGRDVATGDVGEIVVRGPIVMNGYWNRPKLNEQRRRGGWHHTRDLGRRESDGSLSFLGPMARMVKTGSENVYPAEVEACIRRHPAVADVAVIGVPDPLWKQSVKAIVVPTASGAVTEEEIIAHCRAEIASYKKPRSVEFAEVLPRRAGLVDYDALDEVFGGGSYPGERTEGLAQPGAQP